MRYRKARRGNRRSSRGGKRRRTRSVGRYFVGRGGTRM